MVDDDANAANLEERLARVEGIAHGLVEKQLKTITIIFALVSTVIVVAGILISVLAIYGKIEVRDATREMERKFEVLAGHALKVPIVHILYESGELNQKVITAKVEGKVLHLSEIQLKNTGDRSTEFISVRLQFAAPIQSVGQWQSTLSSDKEFPSASFFGGPYQISPQETWTLPAFVGAFAGEVPAEIRAKVQAFYGQERPAEALVTIRTSR